MIVEVAAVAVISFIAGYGIGTPKTVEQNKDITYQVDTKRFSPTGSAHSSGSVDVETVNADEVKMTASVHGDGRFRVRGCRE